MADTNNKLINWGWNDFWSSQAEGFTATGMMPARVVDGKHKQWRVQTALGPRAAQVDPSASISAPVVGDWVMIKPGSASKDPVFIQHVLPRKSKLSGPEVGDDRREKILGANIERIWFIHGLDVALNLNRIERYLEVARQSSAIPEIVLTKKDIVQDLESIIRKIKSAAPAVSVHAVSSSNVESIHILTRDLRPGETVCLVGPSDAGKSTLLSLLSTGQVGTETTDPLGLFSLPGGACILDTQDIRNMRIWIMEEGLEDAFPDIDALAKNCRFKDCGHSLEPGCAVISAVETGALDRQRLRNFRKLQRDAALDRHGVDDLPTSSPTLWDSLKKRIKRS